MEAGAHEGCGPKSVPGPKCDLKCQKPDLRFYEYDLKYLQPHKKNRMKSLMISYGLLLFLMLHEHFLHFT